MTKDTRDLIRFCLVAPFVTVGAVGAIAGAGWLVAEPSRWPLALLAATVSWGAAVLPRLDWRDTDG
jgi:hypothetical protein